MKPDEEYQQHYSPEGERIEYLMEHPEENVNFGFDSKGRYTYNKKGKKVYTKKNK